MSISLHIITSDIEPIFPFRMNVNPEADLSVVFLLVAAVFLYSGVFFLLNSSWMSYCGTFLVAAGAIRVQALPMSCGTTRRKPRLAKPSMLIMFSVRPALSWSAHAGLLSWDCYLLLRCGWRGTLARLFSFTAGFIGIY